METELAAAARRAGKPVTGIETMAEQLTLLSRLGGAREAEFLAATLDELGSAQDDTPRLVALWAKGDAERLGRLLVEEDARFPDMKAQVIDARNRRFAAWIADRMARPGTLFVAVGAGHLAGRDGVPALLCARGLVVRRAAWQPGRTPRVVCAGKEAVR